jgi:hypothetical protein
MSQYSDDLTPDPLSVVTPPGQLSATPQFGTAEYAHIPGTERCRVCNNLISGEYYRVNGQMACKTCALQGSEGQPSDSHAAFVRGVALGIGGAIAGMILYSAVAIATGWTIGYLALAVGWLVGKGMMKGSNGIGGRRYQIAAVILTYVAISLSAIPVGISYAMKHPHATASKQTTSDSASADDEPTQAAPAKKQEVHLGAMVGQLFLYGIASPFIEFTGNVASAAIGLFILFIGLRIAWTITQARPLAVDGPYGVGS